MHADVLGVWFDLWLERKIENVKVETLNLFSFVVYPDPTINHVFRTKIQCMLFTVYSNL